MSLAASIIIWVVAAFYLYGAGVHVLNMLGHSGFDWTAAPLKWQVLDVAYLVLDAVVVVGLILAWKVVSVPSIRLRSVRSFCTRCSVTGSRMFRRSSR